MVGARTRQQRGIRSGDVVDRRVGSCAEGFLRILAAADQELPAREVEQLEEYVQRCLAHARSAMAPA